MDFDVKKEKAVAKIKAHIENLKEQIEKLEDALLLEDELREKYPDLLVDHWVKRAKERIELSLMQIARWEAKLEKIMNLELI